MKVKVIYKNKTLAGFLWRDKKGYHFEYHDDFINDNSLFPISINFPKSTKTYHADKLFPFFQSMLAEGYNRKMQSKALGIDPHDDWALLINSCDHDTIGAITIERDKD